MSQVTMRWRCEVVCSDAETLDLVRPTLEGHAEREDAAVVVDGLVLTLTYGDRVKVF